MDGVLELLSRLISVPSVSRSEDGTARVLMEHLEATGFEPRRIHNNVWTVAPGYDPARPTLMLNSHHDTVRPAAGYTRDPYLPTVADGRLYGLGSNDAGASLVSLVEAFTQLAGDKSLPFNLILALSAEEEVSGEKGLRALLPEMERCGFRPDMAIVGEPTGMQPAIAERGLLVLDCTAHGRSGHAARDEGDNALYRAIDDINRLRSFRFERESAVLGPIKLTTTMIECGTQHNVVPDTCRFVVDVRTTDAYTNLQTVELIRQALQSDVQPRSTHLSASVIASDHPLVVAALSLGMEPFVSPTMSDKALMPHIPALKIGPGQSARSHTADEFVMLDELAAAPARYCELIRAIKL